MHSTSTEKFFFFFLYSDIELVHEVAKDLFEISDEEEGNRI